MRIKVVKEAKDMLKEVQKCHLLKENNVRMKKSKLKRKSVKYPQIKLIKMSVLKI